MTSALIDNRLYDTETSKPVAVVTYDAYGDDEYSPWFRWTYRLFIAPSGTYFADLAYEERPGYFERQVNRLLRRRPRSGGYVLPMTLADVHRLLFKNKVDPASVGVPEYVVA